MTVVRAVRDLLPGEDILYLGDTARMPYGSKSPETIRRFADEDVRFLLAHGVKAVMLACNTVTAYRSEEHKSELPSTNTISYSVFGLKKKQKT